MTTHAQAFRAQSDFALEAKIKVGADIWTPETAGSRLYAEVLSKAPATVGIAIDLAVKLEPPFTAKQTMGHLRWLYTAGELEVDGKSYVVEAKPAKVVAEKPAKAKAKKAKVMAARKRTAVKTQKVASRHKGETLSSFVQRLYEEGMHPDAAIQAGKKEFGTSKKLWKNWRGLHMTNVTVDLETGMAYDKKDNVLNLDNPSPDNKD